MQGYTVISKGIHTVHKIHIYKGAKGKMKRYGYLEEEEKLFNPFNDYTV